jgi:methionyl aminopeptidase
MSATNVGPRILCPAAWKLLSREGLNTCRALGGKQHDGVTGVCSPTVSSIRGFHARTGTSTKETTQRRFKSDVTSMTAAVTHKKRSRSPVAKQTVTEQRRIPVLHGKHSHIVQPPYAQTGQLPFSIFGHHIVELQNKETVKRLRKAGALAAHVLKMACGMAKPGITTDDIDILVHEAILAEGAYPSPLNYRGFPKSVCSSVNEVICHGIPDMRELEYGDVVSFDVSCFLNGVHGDNCATVIVGDDGNTSDFEEERRLVATAQEALRAAIATCAPGSCLSDIGGAISDVAEANGYSTIEEYRGHGIGETFHCAPFVKHYRNFDKLELTAGMVFTIEPMLVTGNTADTVEWSDGWTVATADGGLAAQFEHMIYVSETGIEILTENPGLNPSGL